MGSERQETGERISRIVLACAAIYALAFALSYLSDPLSLSPQLDAKENLVLAKQFSEMKIDAEPFYRAVLYPGLLSFINPQEARPLIGLLLGLGCHLLNALLVSHLAKKLWRSPHVGTIAAVLYLLNPASLFYSLQILDITLATTLFLLALTLGQARNNRLLMILVAGLLLGLCVLTRPHFLPAALIVPVVLVLLSYRKSLFPLLCWGPMVLVLLLQGIINFQLSEEFRILPWQGSYNLWAANKPGANGLYLKQSIDLSGSKDIANPTKSESIILYGQSHPDETPPYSVKNMNAYWRGEFLHHLRENPIQVVKLWFYKGYAILNSYEQYNNLSFSFHKARLPMLRYNPMNWGIVLIAGMLGLLQLLRERPFTGLALIGLIVAYSVSLVLFFASARFRLPLVPLLAILSGGMLLWVHKLNTSRSRLITTLLVIFGTGAIAYSSFSGIRNTDTYVQDRLLMANANADLGNDLEAARWTRLVLEEFPGRREAQRIYAVSYFNMRLLQLPGAEEFGSWEDQKTRVLQSPPTDPVQDVIIGVYFWQWGHRGEAIQIWKDAVARGGEGTALAQSCLNASGLEKSSGTGLSALDVAVQNMFISTTKAEPHQ